LPARQNETEDPAQADVEEWESHAGWWPNVDRKRQSRGL